MPDHANYPFGRKYIVQRQDGSVPEWPWFVLGGCDPFAPRAILHYAGLIEQEPSLIVLGLSSPAEKQAYVSHLVALARAMEEFASDRARVQLQEPDRPVDAAVAEKFALVPRRKCVECRGVGRVAGLWCSPCGGTGWIVVPTQPPG